MNDVCFLAVERGNFIRVRTFFSHKASNSIVITVRDDEIQAGRKGFESGGVET